MKIGIVGADGNNPAWTPERETKVKIEIRTILQTALAGNIYLPEKKVEQFQYKPFGNLHGKIDVILVSGHCPVGEEQWYCCDCEKWLPLGSKEYYEHFCKESKIPNHKVVWVYDKGGVDVWAEIIATELGVAKEIYPAPAKQWNDKYESYWDTDGEWTKRIKGFRSRNIDMANAIPLPPNGVLYDIEPKGSCKHCGGKGVKKSKSVTGLVGLCGYCGGSGNYSGGTWTKNYTEKSGKEVHQVVIE